MGRDGILGVFNVAALKFIFEDCVYLYPEVSCHLCLPSV